LVAVVVVAVDLAVGVLLALVVVHPQSLQEHNQFQLYRQRVALVVVLVLLVVVQVELSIYAVVTKRLTMGVRQRWAAVPNLLLLVEHLGVVVVLLYLR
jgi:hypothetical protein